MPRTRTGFTLIELLIVVVIIGILAAIAIPKFQNTKGKANAAALRSDLRNLAVAQEAYFFQTASYASDTALLNFRPSPGVILTLSTPGVGRVGGHGDASAVLSAAVRGVLRRRVADTDPRHDRRGSGLPVIVALMQSTMHTAVALK